MPKNRTVVFDIELYEIFYPNKPVVQLIVSGIFNAEKLSALAQSMIDDPCEDKWLGYRTNTLYYDEKSQSSEENLYLYFDVERNKPVKIHCNYK
ncbi:MAG: hypothetical protein K6L75_14540 [Cellvibrionaceae bacterium]